MGAAGATLAMLATVLPPRSWQAGNLTTTLQPKARAAMLGGSGR
jgi:hypothetical protein